MPTRTASRRTPPASSTAFDDALAAFLDYLSAYRGYSPHTVKAYARDVRAFRDYLVAPPGTGFANLVAVTGHYAVPDGDSRFVLLPAERDSTSSPAPGLERHVPPRAG